MSLDTFDLLCRQTIKLQWGCWVFVAASASTHSPWKALQHALQYWQTHTSIIAPVPKIHLDDILDNGHLLRCTVQLCGNLHSREKWGMFWEFAGRRLRAKRSCEMMTPLGGFQLFIKSKRSFNDTEQCKIRIRSQITFNFNAFLD